MYNTVEDTVSAIGLSRDEICLFCVTGDDPLEGLKPPLE